MQRICKRSSDPERKGGFMHPCQWWGRLENVDSAAEPLGERAPFGAGLEGHWLENTIRRGPRLKYTLHRFSEWGEGEPLGLADASRERE